MMELIKELARRFAVVLREPKLMRIACLIPCLLAASAWIQSEPKPPACTTPLWRRDVIQDPREHRVFGADHAGIIFLDSQRLIVWEVDADLRGLAARENADISSPYRLRLHLLDGDSGAPLSDEEWGTRIRGTTVHVAKGGLLVQTGDETLRVLSPKLKEIGKLRLSNGDEQDEAHHWGGSLVSVSPTGKTVMINRLAPKYNFSRLDVLDGTTFNLKYTWRESPPLYHGYSIADDGMVAANQTGNAFFHWTYGVEGWTPFGDPLKAGCTHASALLDDETLLAVVCNQLRVLSSKGSAEQVDVLDKDEHPYGAIEVAQGGRFAALALERIEIKNHFFSEPSIRTAGVSVHVYDLSSKKPIFSVEIAPFPKNDFGFALSPDGSKLAILKNHEVSVCSIRDSINSREHVTGNRKSENQKQQPK